MQGTQNLRAALHVLHDHAFGNLDVDAVFRSVVDEHLADEIHEIALPQLDGRNVDRNALGVDAFGAPLPENARGFGQSPFADIEDHSCFFQDGDETRRRDQPAIRIVPADERFESFYLAAREADLGLVVEHETMLFQRFAELVFQYQPFGDVGV